MNRIRIWMRNLIDADADPGFGAALQVQPIRIHITAANDRRRNVPDLVQPPQ